MPNAVAYAVRGTTKLKIVGSLANPNAASAKGSVTRPKTATQGRQRNSSVSGRLMLIGVVARRKGSVTKGREKRRMRGEVMDDNDDEHIVFTTQEAGSSKITFDPSEEGINFDDPDVSISDEYDE